MSIKSFDDAHDFFPAEAANAPNLLSTLQLVWRSMREGRAAHHAYEGLRAKGVPHAEAASQALSTVYPGR